MANILSLAVRVTGDASGLQLNPVEKALQRLQTESDKTSKIFEKFAQTSELGAKAQETFDAASAALLQTLRDGNITRDEFVKQFAELEAGARETAAALAEGARVTEANRTAEERYAAELQRLNGLREKGGIDQETYNRAVASARKPLDDAAAAAERAAQASGNSALKFNELSGVFAVLPGPLGNIAGRISGITSASEGLTRIFSGGLQSGLSNLVGSFTALATPVNLALAGVTAFAAGASALANGLVAFEDRVERLSRLANQLGVSFEFTQVLEEAGKRADVGVQQISGAFARLQKTLNTGGEESKKASQALGNLGISLEQFATLSEQQQIELIAQNLAGIEDPAKRSAAAMDLFGKSGVQLLPFFNELPGAATDIERFGSALSDEDQQRFVELGASFDALGVSLLALSQNALLPFVELVTSTTNVLAELIGGLAQTADAIGSVLRPVLEQIGNAFELLAPVIEQIGKFLLPAVVAQVVFLNGAIVAGAISSLASTFTAAGAALIAFATSGSVAAVSTRALGAAIRTTLSSTGVGALVVVVGLAVDALASWAFASDEAADKLDGARNSATGTAAAIEKVRETVAKPIDPRVFREIASEASRTTSLLEKSARDIGVSGQESGVAYIRLVESIRSARLNIDQTTAGGAQEFLKQVQRANDAYERQIALIKSANDERLRQIQSEQGIVNKLLEQRRIQEQFGGDTARAQAADNTSALTSEIRRLQTQLLDVINTDAEDELRGRISLLKELRQQEVDIASGRTQRREAEYQRERERVQAIADERERVEKEASDRIAQQRKTINEFVNEQLALQQFDGDAQKLAAYRNVLAIEEEIKRVETEGANARARGDTQGLNAAIARIGQLDQIAAKENDIASGRAAAEEELAKARDESLKEQQKQVEAYAKAQEQQASQAQAAQQKQNEEFQKFFEASAAENERVLEKNRQLATASTEAAQGADIRTTEGANAFIAAVQGGFDPQLALQRQQLKVLQRIDGGLALNLARLGFQTVAFPGRAGG